MKTPHRLIGVLAVLTASSLLTAIAAEPDRAHAAIESQALAFADAMRRGDAAAVADLFTADAKLGVPGANGVVSGRAAIEQFWRAALNGGMGALSLTIGELEGHGDLRFETGRYAARAANGAELGTGDYLIVWKREAGVWKIHRDYAPPAAPPGVAREASAPETSQPGAKPGSRIAFPANYQKELTTLGIVFNDNNSEITATFANTAATSVDRATRLPYPEGAVFVMEFASALRDGEGRLIRDTAGKVSKGEILHVDVMRKGSEPGDDEAEFHAGKWEFASYRADGSVAVTPSAAGHCAACHRNAGAVQDFVFRQRAPLPR